MLLPQVYKNYCTTFHEAAKHLQYTMKQRSAGTLLYRRGSDPLLMLTKVLHREHSGFYHHQAPKDETEMNEATTICTTATDMNSKIWEEMNTKIHDQIAKNLNNQQGVPFDISEFDIDKWVELMDKDIMKMLAVLIKPKREKKSPL